MIKDILVMDCEERKNFWIAFKSEHKIHYVTSAEEGLKILSEDIRLIFLNTRLPDINDTEILRLIKRKYPSTSVILITSCGKEDTCSEGSREGARGHLNNQLKAEEILQKIKALLNSTDESQGQRDLYLSTKAIQNENSPDIPSHFVKGVQKVTDFVVNNYSESLSLSSACKMALLCKTYFCRYFKLLTGLSLRSYHHAVKIRKAEELLKDKKLCITEVAQHLGYNDSNYFSTIFKKINGISPREWQTSYINLYMERNNDSSPKCRKAIVKGLDRMKKVNDDLIHFLEDIEP